MKDAERANELFRVNEPEWTPEEPQSEEEVGYAMTPGMVSVKVFIAMLIANRLIICYGIK